MTGSFEMGFCLLAAPEILVGAIVVAGVVVVGFAIKEALDSYELRWGDPEKVRPVPETRPVPEVKPAPEMKPAPQKPSPKKRPKPEPKGPDFPPLEPPEVTERDRRPDCTPRPVPHRGGHDPHNQCADRIPNNNFTGWDVRVNGKDYDGLQLATLTLWDVKTDDFDKHSRRSQQFFIEMKLPEIQRERRLAEECGYEFVLGVRSEAHKAALEWADKTLEVVVMDWC